MNLTNTGIKEYLSDLCERELTDAEQLKWFRKKQQEVDSARAFFLSFGLIGRKIPRVPVVFESDQLEVFTQVNSGFDLQKWTLDDLCRLSLILSLDTENNKEYIATLIAAADMREQIIIYRSLPFLANPKDFVDLAIDGLRTNMVDVYDAIALDNNFPVQYFPDNAWNQMVLKAIFMERPIYRIQGLDDRTSQTLADILHDFVHERWSARRPVTPELWRLVRGYLTPEIFKDLKKVATEGEDLERAVALKALSESAYEPALQWLEGKDLTEAAITWEEIGKRILEGK